MQPIRKSFFGDPMFPFESVYRTIKKQSNELPEHLHDRFEFVYIHQGTGVFFIDNTWYEKKTGDIFIIPGNTIHHSLPYNDDPIISSALYFSPTFLDTVPLGDSYNSLLCYELARKKKSYRIEPPAYLKDKVASALEQIDIELKERQIGYHESVRLITRQLLLNINRFILNGTESNSVSEARIGPSWMKEALRDIDEHPEYTIGLTQLAQKANVSAPHFSRVFKQLTTMNITQYVNIKRIIKAKELLAHSELKISGISEQCGFDTPTHFYRVFKTLTGLTPNKFRHNYFNR